MAKLNNCKKKTVWKWQLVNNVNNTKKLNLRSFYQTSCRWDSQFAGEERSVSEYKKQNLTKNLSSASVTPHPPIFCTWCLGLLLILLREFASSMRIVLDSLERRGEPGGNKNSFCHNKSHRVSCSTCDSHLHTTSANLAWSFLALRCSSVWPEDLIQLTIKFIV